MKTGEEHIMGKRAEMSSTTLITIIILILSFLIILAFIFFLDLGGETDRTACHQSVLVRGSLPDSLGRKELPPLKCSTRKICITDKIIDKGECEDELGTKYDTVRVAKGSEMENEINAFVAEEMASCWSMMGEGKVQVFTGTAEIQNPDVRACSVCSRIAFDKSIKGEKKEIIGLVEYLLSHKIPNQDVYYWDYIVSGLTLKEYDPTIDKYSTEQKAIIYLESSKTATPALLGRATGTGIAAFAVGSIGSAVGPTGTIVGGVAGGKIAYDAFTSLYEALGTIDYSVGQLFVNYDQSIRQLECDSMENIP